MLSTISVRTPQLLTALHRGYSILQMPLLKWHFGEPPGETLELVAVFFTMMLSLAIMVLLGWWWQR